MALLGTVEPIKMETRFKYKLNLILKNETGLFKDIRKSCVVVSVSKPKPNLILVTRQYMLSKLGTPSYLVSQLNYLQQSRTCWIWNSK